MFHWVMTTRLKDVVEPNDIALDVSIWILYRVSYSRLCCKVHHHVKLVLCKQLVYQCFVSKFTFHELISYPSRDCFLQFLESVVFQANIVVSVQIINIDNRCTLSFLKQTFDQIRANESGTAVSRMVLPLRSIFCMVYNYLFFPLFIFHTSDTNGLRH